MSNFRTPRLKSRLLGATALAFTAVVAPGLAQAATTTPANDNVLNLLSDFLSLNATAAGRATLSANLSQAIAVNNGATPTLEELSYSDKNILGSASNTVTGISGAYGAAGNLAGTIPNQPAATQGGQTGVPGVQSAGGYGTVLGAIYNTGINASTTPGVGPLANTSKLLVSAYNFTSSDLGVAKFYFANGTTNGTSAAVAAAGYTLPTYDGLPNTTTSVYDQAYGVTNTGANQNIYGDSRPAQASSSINLFDPTALNGINTNPAFPSGHTNYAYTDSILLGMLEPEEYQSMLSRAAQYANSRIVLGVHYPLDIIASRSFSAYDLAQAFTNPSYINNATTTGTAINLPSLFTTAQAELTTYLSAQCGASVATCAASGANQNSLSPSAANAATYAYDLNYGLPTLSYMAAPREQAPTGGPDASILLATVYGGSTSAAQTLAPTGGIDGSLSTGTINQIIVNTEGQALSAFYGTALSYWSRINLYAAAGYFSDVTGVLDMASTDVVTVPATVASTGVLIDNGALKGGATVQSGGELGGVGSVTGALSVQSGGVLAPGGFTAAGVQTSAGTLTVNGSLSLASGSTYDVVLAPKTASTVAVSGAATLGGSVSGSFSGTTFAPKYTILTAGSVSGSFSGASVANEPGLTETLSYDGKDAYLNVAIGPSVPGGYNQNQQSVVNGLNGALASSGSLSLTYAALTGATLEKADGEIGATASTVVSEAGMGLLGAFFNGGLSAPNSPDRTGSDIAMYYTNLPTHKAPAVDALPKPFTPYWSVWASTFGDHQTIDGVASTGSNTLTATNWSELVAAEYRSAPDTAFAIGFGGGASDYSIAGAQGSGTFNYGELTAYGVHNFGSWYVSAGGAAGAGDMRYSRTDPLGGSLHADYVSSNAVARLEIGDAFGFGTGAAISPYAAAEVSYVDNPGYSETGGSGAYNLNYATGGYSNTTTELGFRVKDEFVQNGALFSIGGELAWAHAYESAPSAAVSFAALPGSNFTVYGVGPASDTALVEAGGKVAFGNGWALEARFNGQFGSGEQAYGGRGTVSFSW